METALPIAQALAEVMKAVGGVAKKDKNTSQGFNFRGIDSVVNAVSPALQKYGVLVVPSVEDYDYSTVEIGRNRTAMGHVRVKVTYTFIGANGDSIKSTVVAEAMDAGDKATTKAMSVAFRTALLQSLCLPTDDADPDASSYERSSEADVMPVSVVEKNITLAKDLETLARVGQYITENKNGYNEGNLNYLRAKFQEQQAIITPPKLEEDTNAVESIDPTRITV